MFLPLSHIVSLLWAPFVLPRLVASDKHPLQQLLSYYNDTQRGNDFRVAIIGAGIAGASAAYHIHNESASGASQNRPVTITIYESSDEVGGQIKTISPPDHEGRFFKPLELGSSSFFEDDWCLMEAAQATNTVVSQSRLNRGGDGAMWILNKGHFLEDRFCESIDFRPRFWRWREVKRSMSRALSWLRFELTHRFLPLRIRRGLRTHQKHFQHFGRNGTFGNVLQELRRCGLQDDVISSTASEFLGSLGLSHDFQRTYLEPCVKGAFGLGLDEAHGLHAIQSSGAIRSSFPLTALGGNQRFIKRLVDESEASLRLGSRVMKVEAGNERRYALTVTSSEDREEKRLEYDAVIATGNALSEHQLGRSRESQREQVTTYKTYFSSLSSLAPDAIGAISGGVPYSILFTTGTGPDHATSNEPPFGLTSLTTWPWFYIDRSGCSFDDMCDQFTNLYIAESSGPLPEETIHRLTKDYYINWTKDYLWHRALPLVNNSGPSLGEIEIDNFLFNASNTIINTMEMSCRIGRNIALKVAQQSSLSM